MLLLERKRVDNFRSGFLLFFGVVSELEIGKISFFISELVIFMD